MWLMPWGQTQKYATNYMVDVGLISCFFYVPQLKMGVGCTLNPDSCVDHFVLSRNDGVPSKPNIMRIMQFIQIDKGSETSIC